MAPIITPLVKYFWIYCSRNGEDLLVEDEIFTIITIFDDIEKSFQTLDLYGRKGFLRGTFKISFLHAVLYITCWRYKLYEIERPVAPMSINWKTVQMYILRGFNYVIWAGFFGAITVWYWVVMPDVINAYMWNVLGISIALIIDKVRLVRIYKKIESCTDDKLRKKLAKKDVTSLRISLYIFHIFALIFSQVLSLDAGIQVSDNVRSYFQTVEMGILVLFAIDNLIGYLITDDGRVRMFKEKYQEDIERDSDSSSGTS